MAALEHREGENRRRAGQPVLPQEPVLPSPGTPALTLTTGELKVTHRDM